MKNILYSLCTLLTAVACNPAQKCVENPKSDCICTKQYDPVCGCNGKTYGNACMAVCAGIGTFTKRICARTDVPDNMVFIPGGTFRMGSKGGYVLEKPVHTVTVSNFYMSKYEVTIAEFKQFVDDTRYTTVAEKSGKDFLSLERFSDNNIAVNWRTDANGNLRPTSEYNHPVSYVTRAEALAYATWKSKKTGENYRLPTEAEWEYAAGGGDPKTNTRTKWAGTSNQERLPLYAHLNGSAGTRPVGSLLPNALGLYDMSGNVLEWCSDWYHEYRAKAQTNPFGSEAVFGLARGGDWGSNPESCRVACRIGDTSDDYRESIGFRLVLQ